MKHRGRRTVFLKGGVSDDYGDGKDAEKGIQKGQVTFSGLANT